MKKLFAIGLLMFGFGVANAATCHEEMHCFPVQGCVWVVVCN